MYVPTALIFRGQPAQYAGMARAVAGLKEAEPVFSMVREAAKKLGIEDPLNLLSYDVGIDDLRNSVSAHMPVLSINHILKRALYERAGQIRYPLQFQAVAGHSLGQLSAFEASGAVRFREDVLPIALVTSHYLHEFSQKNRGGLTAVLLRENGSLEQLQELKARLNYYGVVVALENTPTQVVVGGLEEELLEAEAYLKETKIKFARIPKIEGPFHTIYVQDPSSQAKPLIDGTAFSGAEIPVWANSTGRAIYSPEDFQAETYFQIFMPVLWRQTIQGMVEQGITRFFVIDPSYNGEAPISKTIERIKPDADILTIRDAATLDAVIKKLPISRA